MAPSAKKKALKQGNLFSFFNKKPTSATPTAPPATTPAVDVALGTRIEVYLAEDDEWYGAKVEKRRGAKSNMYYVHYDDGQLEWLDLSTERFRKAAPAKKRRITVQEESDGDEMELEDGLDPSDGEESAYNEPAEEEDDEQEANADWMVSDDEEDMEISGKTPVKRKVLPTKTPTQRTPKLSSTQKSTSRLSQFSASKVQITEHVDHSNKTPTLTSRVRPLQVTPDTSPPFSASKSTVAAPPPFVPNALNPAGSHVHNHLPFLQNPVDARGRSRDHPDYDPRTLTVKEKEWLKVTNSKKMTDGTKQWWDLKARYFDTVLLFKTGTSWTRSSEQRIHL